MDINDLKGAVGMTRRFRFDDFLDQTLVDPEKLSRIDALTQEVRTLREQVQELKPSYDTKWVEDWFHRHIVQLANEAAKQLDHSRMVSALEEAGLRRIITERVGEQVQAKFETEAPEMCGAIYNAILKRLGRG